MAPPLFTSPSIQRQSLHTERTIFLPMNFQDLKTDSPHFLSMVLHGLLHACLLTFFSDHAFILWLYPASASSRHALYPLDSCLDFLLISQFFILRVPSHSPLQSFGSVQPLPLPTMFPSLNSHPQLLISKLFLLLTVLHRGCFSICAFN